ncbi:MAG TPA: nitrophenyl compound nitroreductase subunit ArsF family protein [Bacteroides mediterraneensis]|uniref:nitrophenyl compound nitroreductase subunit ArsF family protein n=1 Tax=Bacteroides mediterraneensis TaxID=1841856 RepID=UPI00262A8B87|nr:nitrophenyl compound nitroreductase subunit ArsF family protein [Bacteroides mediterraneensis]HJH65981.1 nitrophenyl compound nitroreductase subunit ArsF family protein [Bacteroides mediterraneensis]
MKRMLFLLATCLLLSSCGMNSRNETTAQTETQTETIKDGVEVLYFHGKQRCATCIAIEKNTRAVTDSLQTVSSDHTGLTFRIIDISKAENEELARKYEVTWSSLFLVRHKNGQETAENLTEFAFKNARKSPETFQAGLARKIHEMQQ